MDATERNIDLWLTTVRLRLPIDVSMGDGTSETNSGCESARPSSVIIPAELLVQPLYTCSCLDCDMSVLPCSQYCS